MFRSQSYRLASLVVGASLMGLLLQHPCHGQSLPRVPWTSSQVKGTPEPPPPYRLERAFPQLAFDQPVELVMVPGTKQWVVVELNGRIYSFKNDESIAVAELVIDLKQHLPRLTRAYSIAFHPNVAENHYCYISYIEAPGQEKGTHVSRFKLSQLDPPRIDPASEEVIIRWLSGGHNGACLRFGPDGFLYISTGDGGPAFPPDPQRAGQDVSNLLASILRIDVNRQDAGSPYAIPEDNPFVDMNDARGEVWCYGHRNPWKMSFDAKTGDLWVGDVGWEMWELVFRVQRGGNYGWSVMEGSQRVHYDRPVGPTPILPPTVQHSHIESRSVTGGYVYRGTRWPDLQGRYIYGDYVTGKFWSAAPNETAEPGQAPVDVDEIADSSLQVITFGEDEQHELIAVGYGGGLFRLASNTPREGNAAFPTRLSQTGLFSHVDSFETAPGVLPYYLRTEHWADGATTEHHVAIPELKTLGVHAKQNPQIGEIKGEWKFPHDSILMKTISMEQSPGKPKTRRRLETQILHQHEGTWRPYTYVWNAAQDDAILAPPEGASVTLKITDPSAPGGARDYGYRIAGRSECIMCHTARGGVVYGFRPEQLDRDHPAGGKQLDRLESMGLLAQPVDKHAVFAAVDDDSAELGRRARSYLDVNCAHCHRRGGGGTAALELLYEFDMNRTHLKERPTQGAFNLLDARVVAPGDPYRSVLYYRMAKLGKGRMPHYGSRVVDRKAIQLVRQWIAQMPEGEDETSNDIQELRKRQSTAIKRWQLSMTKKAPQVDLESVDELLSTTSGALMLSEQLSNQPEDERHSPTVQRGANHPDPRIRDLFESFLPPSQRVKRLGAIVDVTALLAKPGDRARGERLFHDASGVQCKNCHQINGRGRKVGPDLTATAKKLNRAQILEAILEPSKKVDPQFQAVTVLTADGEIHSGIVVQRTPASITLATATGKPVTLVSDQVERIAPQQKSLMPELLLRELTEQQVADLLAYLTHVKAEAPR